MSVLIFAELEEGKIKKTSLEAIYYGSKVAEMTGGETVVLAIGEADSAELETAGAYGAVKVMHAGGQELKEANIVAYADTLTSAATQIGAKVIVTAKSSLADAVTARTAGALKAGVAGNVTELPDLSNGFEVIRSVFTGKAFAKTSINSEVKVLAIKKNAITPEISGNKAAVEDFMAPVSEEAGKAKVIKTLKETGTVSLPEADLVVSGGRGMKGPEHWQPLLDLAEALGATTACSKPVSDMDWRPHHEHVGQTGVKIAPNLYIACGISGAIQHLAGVNSSKVIVVINTDPEAPFFKAADYGIVGDAFEVLPKLTAAVKALK
ncbi:electron transfer flavoprotein subunit alpha/FixB family protein [Jiulongibacter sediminis]|uniref:Electron transfer flavoprotein subunit alpha n=1 Tax=Jiulongibacter sediminis TaxID=1605367 RepID=A0A0P7B9E3_9BACT|nr:electron transfer flavoprotein subunit alpha/FixB family protein [Jiulongibacter sediminis]KPM46976.1 electron transfer flavoprotein subunit alpha [Jiulongibacter sediminis]TBX22321.1 electron transfer flavoprotein subunit alpha [Jiulongibacter sediminis]